MVAIYAVLVLNAMGGLLGFCREYLESFCRTSVMNGEKSGPNERGDEKERAASEAKANTKKDSKKDL